MFGDDQGLGFGQIKYLPGDMIRRHRRGQLLAARGAVFRIMVDGGIGISVRRSVSPLTAAVASSRDGVSAGGAIDTLTRTRPRPVNFPSKMTWVVTKNSPQRRRERRDGSAARRKKHVLGPAPRVGPKARPRTCFGRTRDRRSVAPALSSPPATAPVPRPDARCEGRSPGSRGDEGLSGIHPIALLDAGRPPPMSYRMDKQAPPRQPPAPPPAKSATRQAREAAALRANLRKRKEQAWAREKRKQE